MAKEKTEQVLKEQRTAAETDKNVSEEKVKNKKEKATKRSRKPERAVNLVGAEEIDSIKIEKAKGLDRIKQILKSKKLRKVVWAIVRTVLLTGLCFLVLYPILTLLITSLKSEQDMYDSTVIFIPRSLNFLNYIAMWNHMGAGNLMLNSIVSSLGLGVLQMVSCTLVAYGLARFKFKGRGLIFALVIITLVIPIQLLADSMRLRYQNFNILTMFSVNSRYIYNTNQGLNLIGSWAVFIAMSATAVMYRNGLYIFLLRQYFKNQPKELEEAAKIDGAGRWQLMWHVTLPAIRGTIVLMLIMKVGQLLNTSYEQIFLMQNSMNRAASDVFDTYVYTKGITGGQYSLATATGLFKSTISMLMVVTANKIAKLFGESGLY